MQNLKYEVQILYPSFPYCPPSPFIHITPSTTLLLSFIVSSSSLYYRPRNPPPSYTNCIQSDRDGRQPDRQTAVPTLKNDLNNHSILNGVLFLQGEECVITTVLEQHHLLKKITVGVLRKLYRGREGGRGRGGGEGGGERERRGRGGREEERGGRGGGRKERGRG